MESEQKAHLAVVTGFAHYRVTLHTPINNSLLCIYSPGALAILVRLLVIGTPCLVGNALARAPLLAPLIFNGFSRKVEARTNAG